MKVMFALWGIGDLLAEELTARLADAGAVAVQANIADAAVADAMLRLTAFDEPVAAVVSVWTRGRGEADAVADVLGSVATRIAGWRVEEARPLEPPSVPLGERAPGLANMAFLRRPADLPHEEWLHRWRDRHTEVAIATQATFGYVQNLVLEGFTDDAPDVAAIVEELFPIEALADPHAFYDSAGDNAELARRIERMMRSVSSFGADRDIDVVPTSRYLLR
ncbi:EthD domain-containing protein [Nocardia tenerifensis]|uniref:EthD domain-containing protein n=1 Tax=Nocardia tenerifensis TaxID=228006 RepID=A0A318JX11_9NOCA|nr:EthD domain-containing protein [Nocardia tenerifensis]PXX58166.1 EthD domain-containing protein [Nocardia tenerifensis]